MAETTKKCSGVNREGKDVFESIISRPAPPLPAPFIFSSTVVEKKKVPLKASTRSHQQHKLHHPTPPNKKKTNLGVQRKSSSNLQSPYVTKS